MAEHGERLRIAQLGPSRLGLVGELDLAGVQKLTEKLAGLHDNVILDCSGLTFAGAAALDAFVRIRQACEARGKQFTLVAPPECLLRPLMISGLDEVFLAGAGGSAR